MEMRRFGLFDIFLGEIDKAIKTLTVPTRSARSISDLPQAENLAPAVRARSGRLMRVNHAGEVAAQALYQGQALTARDPAVQKAMSSAAAEEKDHLAWCEQRLSELQSRASLLNPLWYMGSFAMGALAGAVGDRWSLGFVAETERQVESHLREHLERLDPTDIRSRGILEQMTHDEIAHGENAAALGGNPLPIPLTLAMRATSKLMTRGSYWV